MTAVAGLWRFDGRPDAAEDCGRMLSSQKIYGPHASAKWSSSDIALGRNLMRLLPEDAFDRQPLVGAGGRYVLVADIRLDNRVELIDSLNLPDERARSFSDTAILLAAIERWEAQVFGHLVGDYAFALWDGSRRQLILARDPLGQRPLHYHCGKNFFAFATMPKGLHALSEIPRTPDEDRIAEFLALLPEVTGTSSFYHQIERVLPGHAVTVTAAGLTMQRHWQPKPRQQIFGKPEEYTEELRAQLDQAVRCRLRGAENVAAHLSGGFDSSAVAATAARLLAPSAGRVVAFTAVPRDGYDGRPRRNRIVDEGPYAAATAALYPNIEHVLIRDERRSPLDDLDRSFYLCDRPMLNIDNIGWNYSIYDAVQARKLTVLLTGNMGNMGLSYGGLELLPELLRRGRWLQLWREGRALVGPGRMRWRGVLANTFGPWCPKTLWLWLNELASARGSEIGDYSAIHSQRLAEIDISARARMRELDIAYRPWKDGFSKRLWLLRRFDNGSYTKGVLGGWQIDERDPTADVRLLEFCFAAPTEQFLSHGEQRVLAKRALADRLPQLVLNEPRKGLQAADWHERLSAVRPQVSDELDRLDACAPASRALDLRKMRQLVEHWPTEGWERDDIVDSYRCALLRGISTGHFLRRATGANL